MMRFAITIIILGISATANALTKEDVAQIKFVLPQIEFDAGEFLTERKKFYVKHFSDKERFDLSTNEMALKLDKIYNVVGFDDRFYSEYSRGIYRENIRLQKKAITKAFQEQTDFDIADTEWINGCININKQVNDDKPCTKTQAKSSEISTAKAAYEASYWINLILKLAPILDITPNSTDYALIYYSESLNPGKRLYDDDFRKELASLENNKEKNLYYLINSTANNLIKKIKSSTNTKLIKTRFPGLSQFPAP